MGALAVVVVSVGVVMVVKATAEGINKLKKKR